MCFAKGHNAATRVRLELRALRSRVKHSTTEPLRFLKRPLKKKTKNGFQDRLSLNAGQKYCRMLPLEHSAILSTLIKIPFVVKIFVLSKIPFVINPFTAVYNAHNTPGEKTAILMLLWCYIKFHTKS